MKTTIRTGLYYLHLSGTDWLTAHLYEHMLIQSFRNYVRANSYSPYLFGWLSGETFQGVLFIEYGFYNPAIEELFMKFMVQRSRVDLSMLKNEIKRLQAEDEVLLSISDFNELKRSLEELDAVSFINAELQGDIEYIAGDVHNTQSPLVKERKSKQSFRRVTVTVGLPSATIEDKAVFLRATPIIFDALNIELFDEGMYENEVSWPVYNTPHDAMLACAVYTIRKGGLANQDMKEIAEKAIKNIRLDGCERELELYSKGFAGAPNWHTLPIDYYRYTGLLVTRSNIARLFTAENVQRVISSLRVDVVATTSDHLRALK